MVLPYFTLEFTLIYMDLQEGEIDGNTFDTFLIIKIYHHEIISFFPSRSLALNFTN